MTITSFQGEHAFLSNFHPSPIEAWDEIYPTAEHLFQAMKTQNADERRHIRTAPTPGAAKRRGKKCTLRHDWNDIRVLMMATVIKLKFQQNPDLAIKLKATGDEELIEGNTWNDTFWGVCRGKGQNHLGQILMTERMKLI